jgi:ribosomal protein S18 acetylase RimI-like enzyme
MSASDLGELSILRLEHSEIDRVEPLWSALREHHAAVAPSLGATREREDSWRRRRAQYESWLSEPDSFVLIAERTEILVAYAVVHIRTGSSTWPLSERTGELETLSILPGERNHGVGSAMLSAVREHLRDQGVTELALHVVAGNDDAMRFYERHGFDTFGLWLRTNVG